MSSRKVESMDEIVERRMKEIGEGPVRLRAEQRVSEQQAEERPRRIEAMLPIVRREMEQYIRAEEEAKRAAQSDHTD